jgi:hypothetical protein
MCVSYGFERWADANRTSGILFFFFQLQMYYRLFLFWKILGSEMFILSSINYSDMTSKMCTTKMFLIVESAIIQNFIPNDVSAKCKAT